jgi:catechol 2,3-dioxygenase-like lactoylglutathione lyase family enzyme
MKLGCFSISLTVKDLQKSKEFYQALGFTVYHGVEEQGWLIMKSPGCNIGLFQGMFEKNILTFNPGWDQDAQPVDDFTDVRDIQKKLKEKGIQLVTETDADGSGPASITLMDPDGNPVLIDQHV